MQALSTAVVPMIDFLMQPEFSCSVKFPAALSAREWSQLHDSSHVLTNVLVSVPRRTSRVLHPSTSTQRIDER